MVLGAVKDARLWRAPLRGGLRPPLTASAHRAAPDGVGTKGIPSSSIPPLADRIEGGLQGYSTLAICGLMRHVPSRSRPALTDR